MINADDTGRLQQFKFLTFQRFAFRAVTFDTSQARKLAMMKRLFQISSFLPPPFLAAMLTMTSELMRADTMFAKNLLRRKKKKNSKEKLALLDDDDDGEEHFYDVQEGETKKR